MRKHRNDPEPFRWGQNVNGSSCVAPTIGARCILQCFFSCRWPNDGREAPDVVEICSGVGNGRNASVAKGLVGDADGKDIDLGDVVEIPVGFASFLGRVEAI